LTPLFPSFDHDVSDAFALVRWAVGGDVSMRISTGRACGIACTPNHDTQRRARNFFEELLGPAWMLMKQAKTQHVSDQLMHPAVAGQTEVSSRAVDRRFAGGAASFRSGVRIWTQRPVWAAACEADRQVAWAMCRRRSDYALRAQAHSMARWPERFSGLITMAGLLELDHRASYTPRPSSQQRVSWRHGTPRLCS
jgi:hypothetical protein